MKRSRFDIRPDNIVDVKEASALKTLSHDAKRKRCEAESEKNSIRDTVKEEEESNNRNASNLQTTLWMGDLERWEDELHLMNFLSHALPPSCQPTSIKIARDFQTRYHLGYGFIAFDCNPSATEAFNILNRLTRPGHNRIFKVRWAASNTHQGGKPKPKMPTGQQYDKSRVSSDPVQQHRSDVGLTLHIGGLDRKISETEILGLLQRVGYCSVKYVRISRTDEGESRGFGFIKFVCPVEFSDALQRLHGFVLGQKPLQVSVAHRSEQVMAIGADPMAVLLVPPIQSLLDYSQNAAWMQTNHWNPDWGATTAKEQQQIWQHYIQQYGLYYDPQAFQYSSSLSSAAATTTAGDCDEVSCFPSFPLHQNKSAGLRQQQHQCCFACYGDCPFRCLEIGFQIYEESNDGESPDATGSIASLFNSTFPILHVVADPFQYMFS